MMSNVAVYRFADQVYYADTCEPVRKAVAQGELRLVGRARGAYPGARLPVRVLTEVRSVGYWDAVHNQSWGLDWHRNEGIELTYLSRGKLGFAVDSQEFHLKRGDLTITRPWQLHRVGAPNVTACRLYFLILDVGVRRPNQPWNWPQWLASSHTDIRCLTTMLRHNEQPVWEADDEIEFYFERIGEVVEAFETYEKGSAESHLRLYISGLMVAVTDLLRRHQPVLDRSLSSTQRTVELFLSSLPDRVGEPWDLTSMAASCGLRRSQFAYYCRGITNRTPSEYLTWCRVEDAAKLLRNQMDLSITDIALQCGFSSSQYFATVFREHMGCSPREYRKVAIARPAHR